MASGNGSAGFAGLGGLAALALLLASCGGGGAEPAASGDTATTVRISPLSSASAAGATATSTSGGGSTSRSFRTVSFAELQAFLAGAGVRRVEIEFDDDEVEVEEADEVLDDEEIEGRIVALTPEAGGTSGRIVIQLAGALSVEVDFTAATEFELEGADELDEELTLGQFVARVEAALARGERPGVEAKRLPLRDAGGAVVAQDPDVSTFVAREIELEDDDAEIEVNVDADNVSDDTLEGCGLDQGIQVLGVCVEIVPGVTEIEIED